MTEVVRDFQKLSAIMNAAQHHCRDNPLPSAFVGVLDNHPRRRFNVDRLMARLAELSVRPDVRPLIFTGDGPVLTWPTPTSAARPAPSQRPKA